MTGVDSAFGPTPAQAAAVRAYVPPPWPDGTPRDSPAWWLFYCGQRSQPGAGRFGAFNVWTPDQVRIVHDAGFLLVPIFVPLCVAGRIVSADPERDAELAALTLATAFRCEGALELDTEESMRTDPYTREYEQRWTATVRDVIGWGANTYAGGFTFGEPPTGFPHWIWPGNANAGEARQGNPPTGPPEVEGLAFDLDSAGAGFHFATFTG